MNHAVRGAAQDRCSLNGAILGDEFELRTAALINEQLVPRFWGATDGQVDGSTCSVGTGGTLSGAWNRVRNETRRRTDLLPDLMGRAFQLQRAATKPQGTITEGIGNNRETNNLEGLRRTGIRSPMRRCC